MPIPCTLPDCISRYQNTVLPGSYSTVNMQIKTLNTEKKFLSKTYLYYLQIICKRPIYLCMLSNLRAWRFNYFNVVYVYIVYDAQHMGKAEKLVGSYGIGQ